VDYRRLQEESWYDLVGAKIDAKFLSLCLMKHAGVLFDAI
jgi:hypothetical protein